jgi:hypothetical protein
MCLAVGLFAHARDLVSFVPVHDPALAAELWDVPLGTERDVVLRGTPGYEMPPLRLRARVVARTEGDSARAVRLDVTHAEGGSLHLVVTERPPLPIHPSFWKVLGLSARSADVIVQKNFFHYRLFYATTAFRHLGITSGGATSLEEVVRTRGIVPTEPASSLEEWRDADPILKQPKRVPHAEGAARSI